MAAWLGARRRGVWSGGGCRVRPATRAITSKILLGNLVSLFGLVSTGAIENVETRGVHIPLGPPRQLAIVGGGRPTGEIVGGCEGRVKKKGPTSAEAKAGGNITARNTLQSTEQTVLVRSGSTGPIVVHMYCAQMTE